MCGIIFRIFGLGMMTRLKAQLLDTRIGNLTQDEFERNMNSLRIFRNLVKPEAMVISSIFVMTTTSPPIIYLYYIEVDDIAQGKRTLFGVVCAILLTIIGFALIIVAIMGQNW